MNKIPKTYQAPACRMQQVDQDAFFCLSNFVGTLGPFTDYDLINEDFE